MKRLRCSCCDRWADGIKFVADKGEAKPSQVFLDIVTGQPERCDCLSFLLDGECMHMEAAKQHIQEFGEETRVN